MRNSSKSTYIMTTYKGDKAYNYFRVPSHLMQFFGKKFIRLSDDRERAEAEALAIVSGTDIQYRSEPTEAEIAAAKKMLVNATGRTKKKGMESSIDVDTIIDMLRRQSFRCAVTLLPFDLEWRKKSGAARNAFAPSLDRIDNSLGYSRENCRIVLSAVNYAMNEWGLETYIAIADAASRHGMRTRQEQIPQTKS